MLGKFDPRPVQPDSLFSCFSVTKGITAGLVHWLADQGYFFLQPLIHCGGDLFKYLFFIPVSDCPILCRLFEGTYTKLEYSLSISHRMLSEFYIINWL